MLLDWSGLLHFSTKTSKSCLEVSDPLALVVPIQGLPSLLVSSDHCTIILGCINGGEKEMNAVELEA